MKPWLALLLTLTLAACGGGKTGPTVGGNNGNNGNNGENNGADMGGENNGTTPSNNGVTANNGTTANNDGMTANNGTVDMGMPPEDMSQPIDMSQPEDMNMPPDMAPDLPPACPPRAGVIGDPCDCDAQCNTMTCVGETATESGFCTRTCTSRADCNMGAGACIEEMGTGVSHCWPDDTGSPCTTLDLSDPSLCQTNLCLGAGGSSFAPKNFCSLPCDDSSDCKIGHACAPARCKLDVGGLSCLPTLRIHRDAMRDTLKVVYPLERTVCMPIGAQIACSPQNEVGCASGTCDPDANRCTAECIDTLDCPVGGCADVDLVTDPDLPIRVCDL